MTIETEKDLEGLRRIGRIVAQCLKWMGQQIEPGMTTKELDALGRQFLDRHEATSAPRLTYRFPGDTCISVNEEIAHGIPGPRVIAAGDMVNIDVSAKKDGYVADTGGSFVVPPVHKTAQRVCAATREALDAALAVARDGQALNLIGKAIEDTARRRGLTVVRNLGSHGVGRHLHEEPKFIAPYFDQGDRRRLRANQVITIEPFLSTGSAYAEECADGWTLRLPPRQRAAQYEHTIVITKGSPLIMTLP